MSKLVCPICGEPTSNYMGNYRKDGLCRKHGKMANAGEIVQCEDCGKWHGKDEECECQLEYDELPSEGFENCILCGEASNGYAFCKDCWREHDDDELLDILNTREQLKSNIKTVDAWKVIDPELEYDELPSEGFDNCILCGSPSNGYAFCKDCWQEYDDEDLLDILNEHEQLEPNIKDTKNVNKSICLFCGKPVTTYLTCFKCYNKYKNKEVLVKISHCKFPFGEPLDESYEGVYECLDGHVVKSQAERDIDNYLYENNIFHGYEQPLDVGTVKPLKPDFCLKNYLGEGKDVYLEYFGYENSPKYDKRTKYKMPLYKEKRITLICMYAKTDLKNLIFALKTKLNKNKIKENEINYQEDE